MQDNGIDVKKIMEEIRKEIQERGYNKSILSFSDVVIEKVEEKNKFLLSEWKHNLYMANLSANNSSCNNSVGIKKVLKRIVRKGYYIIFRPIINDQKLFNSYVVNCLNQIDNYMANQKDESN
ncbi:hypothetical protein [Lacrimispora sp.]|uniref:hypothetical protein n=1 Tax=Lacrimispora sp. TaxID=2719234 RepID=UPI0039945D02